MSSWISLARCLAQGRIGVLMVWILEGVFVHGVDKDDGVDSCTLKDLAVGPGGLGWPAQPVPVPPLLRSLALLLPARPEGAALVGDNGICGVEMRVRSPTGVVHHPEAATGLRMLQGWHEATRCPAPGVEVTPHQPGGAEGTACPRGETSEGRGSADEDAAHLWGEEAITE